MANETTNATRRYVDLHDVTLKEYFDMRITDLEKSLDERFSSQEKAVKIAVESSNKRLEGMNEFRQTLSDQTRNYVTKSEYEAGQNAVRDGLYKIQEEIKSLQLSRAEIAGKASQNQANVALAMALIGTLMGLIGLAMNIF